MELNLVRELVEERRPGTFANIIYEVECPVKAEYKKQGIKVRKTVNSVVRFNINYRNIKSVKERASSEPQGKQRVNNFVPIVANMLYHNTNTEADYLNVYTCKKHNTKKLYEVHMPFYGEDVWYIFDEDEVRESGILIDSYFKKSGEKEMFRINIDNIFSINGKWA